MANKKYYYARPCDPEFFEYERYYSEDDAINDHFWAGGNRSFSDINENLREDIVKGLNNIYEEIYNYKQFFDTEPTLQEKRDTVKYYLNSEEYFSDTEMHEIIKLAKKFVDTYSKDEENEIICKVLEIIYFEDFITGVIRGASQGDYLEYICPKKMETMIPYIEAVFFGTGTEYAITDSMFEEEPDWSNVSTYTVYTDKWREEDTKADLAKQVSSSCKPEDIKIINEEF